MKDLNLVLFAVYVAGFAISMLVFPEADKSKRRPDDLELSILIALLWPILITAMIFVLATHLAWSPKERK